jgi:hypothetical protein
MSSLTNSAKCQAQKRGNIFPPVMGGVGIGPMLQNVVIMVSHVDTSATISAVRTKLLKLDGGMMDLELEIENLRRMLFNSWKRYQPVVKKHETC